MRLSPSLACLVLRFLLPLFVSCAALVAEPEEPVSIYARTFNGYTRVRLADDSYKPEGYTFAEGGVFGGMAGDRSMDDLNFVKVAKAVAEPLRKQGYVPAFERKNADFIIMVFWGRTGGVTTLNGGASEAFLSSSLRSLSYLQNMGKSGSFREAPEGDAGAQALVQSQVEQAILMQSVANDDRDRANMETAKILGYGKDLAWAQNLRMFHFTQDIVNEVEEDRYFVVLRAYDFRERVEKRYWKLRWELRYSIAARGNAFDKALAAMSARAIKYSGTDQDHLVREYVKEGAVRIGPATVVETDVK